MTVNVLRRISNRRGCSFLTHGSDDYDHRGLNKARRALGKALVAEYYEVEEEREPEPVSTGLYRVVVTTQVYENYGAHAWNGEGECPKYWKAKGGNEYQVVVGNIADVLALGSAGLQRIAGRIAGKVERYDEYFDEYMISWHVQDSSETFEERDIREMLEWGIINKETAKLYHDRMIVTF
jgi:hypothetical protein